MMCPNYETYRRLGIWVSAMRKCAQNMVVNAVRKKEGDEAAEEMRIMLEEFYEEVTSCDWEEEDDEEASCGDPLFDKLIDLMDEIYLEALGHKS